jgi:hypothetical protein
MRAGREIAVLVAAGVMLAAPASAGAARDAFVVDRDRSAQWPAAAVGGGAAHVAWQRDRVDQAVVPPTHAGDEIRYCRLPQKKRRCGAPRTLVAPGNDAGGPRVLLADARTVVILTTRCCIAGPGGGQVTYRFTSTDGGATFSGPVDIGANLLADAELGPGPGVVSTFGPDFAVLPLDGPPVDDKADLLPSSYGGTATNGNAVDSIAFLDAATPIVATSDRKRVAFRRFAGGGYNDIGAWGPLEDVGRGDLPKLAGLPDGSKGTYLMSHVRRGPRSYVFTVRRWTGSGFSRGTLIGRAGAVTSREFLQDAGGRLHAIWLRPSGGGLAHRTSRTGRSWGRTSCIARARRGDQYFDLEVAAGRDGSGLAVWDRGAIFGHGPGPVRAAWFGARGPRCR